MNPPNRAIGIDIGGTKITVAAIAATGQVHGRTSFATDSTRGFPTGLAELVEQVRRVLTAAGWDAATLAGIGIGCAGPVNPRQGTIHNPFTLPGWEDADIVSPLRKLFQVPVFLENDADAAAVGEFRFGAGRGASPLVMVTLGTGVGGAALIHGRIFRGVNQEHPEFGHLVVASEGPECSCGTRGCWESLASGTAIGTAGSAFGFADSRAVFAQAGTDENAAAVVRRAVAATATAAWTLLHTFLPERIILGGGIGEQHFDRFAAAVRQRISTATQVPKDRVEIVKAQLGNDAGVIGAACLSLQSDDSPAMRA